MSAINTAAIASPAGGPRPLGLPARSTMNHDHEEYSSGHYTHSAATVSTQAPMTALEPIYEPIRNGGMVGGMTYDMYPQNQAFHPQTFITRQISPFAAEYRPQSQHAVSIPSLLGTTVGYTGSSLHHASSFNSQPDSSHEEHRDRQLPGNWPQAFNGLSLGR